MNFLQAIIVLYTDFFRSFPLVWISVMGFFGLLIGSFLNVVALRIPNRQSFIYPPSHCVACKHKLSPWDLIPVASYLYLRGCCRYCHQKISSVYPIGELATAAGFALMAAHFGVSWDMLIGLFLVTVCAAVTLTDLMYMLIPDKIVFFSMGVGLLLRLLYHPQPIWEYALGFIVGGGMLYAIAWASQRFLQKEGMGGGDIKFFAFIGLMVGPWSAMLVLFVASLLGTLIGGGMLVSGRWTREQHLPFAPFIAFGFILVYVWGRNITDLYIQIINS